MTQQFATDIPSSGRVTRLVLVLAFIASLHGELAHAAPTDDLLKSLRPTADVNDYAGILSSAERDNLEARCKLLREKSGAQLAVVILKSLDGGQIDDFTVKLFKQWGVGQGDKNNGVLLVVALEDRKARIEVGYGLEPVLPDVLAGRILRDNLFPAFRKQQYAAGLTATVNHIAEIVERNEPAPQNAVEAISAKTATALCLLVFLIPFVSGPAYFGGNLVRARKYLEALFPFLFTGVGFAFAKASQMPWGGYLVLAPCAIVAGLAGYFGTPNRPRPGGRRRGSNSPWGMWDWGGTPWTGGNSSWTGGGFGGGGGGGDWGGFGGGSSGGGGASGGW